MYDNNIDIVLLYDYLHLPKVDLCSIALSRSEIIYRPLVQPMLKLVVVG